MPKYLSAACISYIITMISWAVVATLYETGAFIFTAPTINISLALLLALFMRRTKWTWQVLPYLTFASIVVATAFFPTTETYDTATSTAEILTITEIGACTIILLSILKDKRTKNWFFREAES